MNWKTVLKNSPRAQFGEIKNKYEKAARNREGRLRSSNKCLITSAKSKSAWGAGLEEVMATKF